MQHSGKKIEILDSTLRDGAQAQGISYTLEDKRAIAKKLDKLGVALIECGNPSANQKDKQLFDELPQFKHSKAVAFGSTRRCGVKCHEDAKLLALSQINAEYLSIVGKANGAQVTQILKTDYDENLAMISDSVEFLVKQGKKVIFDAEHFFDGYKSDSEYSLACLKAAFSAGAETIALCDTNGGSFPNEVFEAVERVKSMLPQAKIGIHCHNDNGCAVANSIMAVLAGATHVQGTYLGFGERCGNANLSAIIPSLQIRRGYACIPDECMVRLVKTARFIAEVSNIQLDSHLPYVGQSAFAHKAGMHVDGVCKSPDSFEQVSPEEVGNSRNIILSEMAGRAAMLTILQDIDPTIEKESSTASELTDYLKQLEAEGYLFESAQASLKLKLLKRLNKFSPHFNLINFKVIGEQTAERNAANPSSAMIKIEVNGQTEITAAEGEGPVHALDLALKKAVEHFYPQIAGTRLTDYKVRVIGPSDATAALVRVLITSSDGKSDWTTVGVSRDIVEASLAALLDSVEYMLIKEDEE